MLSQAAQFYVWLTVILYVVSFYAFVLLGKFPVLTLHYLTIVKKNNYSHANMSLTMWLGKSQFSLLYSVRLTEITCLSKGTAQFQSCHDATGCGGNEVPGVSTARDCCLGNGLPFQDGSGICRQCIGKQLHVRGIYLVCWSNLASEDKVSLLSYEWSQSHMKPSIG